MNRVFFQDFTNNYQMIRDVPEIPIKNKQLRDINPLITGHMNCKSQHCYGPTVRDYTLIHYIFSGNGTLYCQGKSYSAHAGQCFIILPGEVNTYIASKNNPWDYLWIGFDGECASKFAELFDMPVFNAPESIFLEILNTINTDNNDNLSHFLAGQIHKLYFLLSSDTKPNNHYASKVKDYIDASYMNNITVNSISKTFHLNRQYLSRIFKEEFGISIKQYLLHTRLTKAAFLLLHHHSVAQTVEMVGYSDIANFSRKFKEVYGLSPAVFSAQKDYILPQDSLFSANYSPEEKS